MQLDNRLRILVRPFTWGSTCASSSNQPWKTLLISQGSWTRFEKGNCGWSRKGAVVWRDGVAAYNESPWSVGCHESILGMLWRTGPAINNRRSLFCNWTLRGPLLSLSLYKPRWMESIYGCKMTERGSGGSVCLLTSKNGREEIVQKLISSLKKQREIQIQRWSGDPRQEPSTLVLFVVNPLG